MARAGFVLILLSIFSIRVQSQDWANLNKYKKENDSAMKLERCDRQVVFMGNSITEGWKRVCPDFFSTNPFINRGISGQTTPQMLVRFREDVIKLEPEMVVILAGTNDIAGNTGPMTLEETFGNIVSMAELALANNIEVILCSVLPANKFGWRPEVHPADKIIKLNKMLKDYADKKDLVYVDYYSEMVDSEKGLDIKFSEDGVHPNKVGYDVMMPLILEAIDEM